MTTAERARRVMFADYASKAGKASQAGRGHRLTVADRLKGVRNAAAKRTRDSHDRADTNERYQTPRELRARAVLAERFW